MFKCTGICSKCGRCQNSAMMSGANDRKTKMLTYPSDFLADKNTDGLGIAFDIGTTTIVGMLWDLKDGLQIATCAKTNPQNEFGMDVISRITYCTAGENNIKELHKKTIDCLNDIINELCNRTEVNYQNILKVAVCGNTTMSHLFSGYSPISLAKAPFDPAYTGTLYLDAKELGMKANDSAKVVVVPNIAGHVGGDITAGVVASRVMDMKGNSLFIDIGTNGEIVLTNQERTFACSTAAGPAFEGSAIKHGMRAATGAIERISIDDNGVTVSTIGETEPQGICGSGLIDAIAQMLNAGIINKKGRIIDYDHAESLSEAVRNNLIEENEERAFILATKEDGTHIVITQNDVREVQLAKGAIAAGIEIMLNQIDCTIKDLDRVIVAGAFGNYIDKESAVRIGLLPKIELEKIISAGNTAGAGVSMVLASNKEEEFANSIPDIVEHIELAEQSDFQMRYLKAMSFR